MNVSKSGASAAAATMPAADLGAMTGGDFFVPIPSEQFVITPYIEEITNRALTYLGVGFPVHFAGPAGTGKTTLAFHVASLLGRPVTLLHGDDEFGSSDLIGKEVGRRRRKVVDNFIHSVLKVDEETKSLWVDNRLTTACREGNTLIYDEFNRSRPEANNALLSVLSSERILNLPRARKTGEGFVKVHPDFRAILTSNPEEYAGTHGTQDALMDRLITINLGDYGRETEIKIAAARSGIDEPEAELIVDITREIRAMGLHPHHPTVRACIAIAQVLMHRGAHARWDDPVFRSVCHDVLVAETSKVTKEGVSLMPEQVENVIRKKCDERKKVAAGGAKKKKEVPVSAAD
jgi:nitric oxide reductase NorQ protein